MIKKIVLENFMNFGERQEISLNSGTNLLLGINGSGKSNFIKAIRLLYEGVAGIGLEKYIMGKLGGFDNIKFAGNEDVKEIKLEFVFDAKYLNTVDDNLHLNSDITYEIIVHEVGNIDFFVEDYMYDESDDKYIISNFPIRQALEYFHDDENHEFVLKKLEDISQHGLILSFLPKSENFYTQSAVKKAIEQISIYNFFDVSENSILRQLAPFSSELKLTPDGSNLTYLLSHLSNTQTKQFNQIIETLKKVNPNFENIGFMVQAAGKLLLTLREKGFYRSITAESVSDGTLRFLLLLAILLNPKRGGLVCIDEPEIGLHPDMTTLIAECLKYANETGTQALIPTHSPLLLNAFELEDVRVFEKNEQNQTEVKTYNEEDFPDLEDFTVGQLWLSGQIGGTRW